MSELSESFKEAQIHLNLLGFDLKPLGWRSLHLVKQKAIYASVHVSLSGKSYIYRRVDIGDKRYKAIYISKNEGQAKWVTKAFLLIAVKINKELI